MAGKRSRDTALAQSCRQNGLDLLRRSTGLRRENLEKAIEFLQCALTIYERKGFRNDWAATLNDLAQAFEVRLCGDPSSNQEEAIRLYRSAQKVYTRKDAPLEWAIIQFNLGNVFLRRISGGRDHNHRQAERCYRDALSVFSKERTPCQWAKVQTSLGVFYLEAVIGDRTCNLEEAINCFNGALSVFGLDSHLLDWARVKNNLGTAWRYRVRGSHADNLEESIRCYQEALQELDAVNHRHLWADIRHNLGISYSQRVRGVRGGNLKTARKHLGAALRARQESGLITEVVKTQRLLLALGMAGQSDSQSDQVEQTIKGLEQLGKTVSRDVSPLEWAKIQLELGNAYIERARGDRFRNIEASIEHYEKALEVIKIHNAPAEWSYLQIGLAAAYRARPIESRQENLSKAIEGLCCGLDTLRDGGWLSQWAKTQNNLAGAYWDRGRYYRDVEFENDKADADFRQAIVHAQKALKFYSREDYPFEWALSNYTIGNALSDLTTARVRARRWRKAIERFRAALEVWSDQTSPLQRAWALNDYGVTLLELAQVAPGGQNQPDLERAIQLFREAIQTHKDSGLRTEVLRSMINLGALYYSLGIAAEAYTELTRAVEIIETLRADALGETGHVHIANQYIRAYRYLVDTCVRRGKRYWIEALERLEAAKGRAFLAEMGTDDYPVPAVLSQAMRAEEAELLKGIQRVEKELRGLELAHLEDGKKKQERIDLLREQEQLSVDYDALLTEMEPLASDYVALRRGNPSDYATLQSLLNQAKQEIGVVELFPVPGQILAFVMRSGQSNPVAIPVDMDEETLKTAHVERFEPVLSGRSTRAWMGDLGDRLFSEALTHLAEVDLVYLVPTGLLHVLPLHALPVGNQSLMERFPVAYTPSLSILSRVVGRTHFGNHEDSREGLVVGNPTGWSEDSLGSLEGAEKLAREIADRFSVNPLLRSDATKQGVLEKLSAARVVFFACHGYFNKQVPLYSGLYLARTDSEDELKDILTIREIMQLSLSAELVILSACQSGVSDVKWGDELTGLARAFLYAGASAVVVALWKVAENSTTELMRHFFDQLYPKGIKKAQTAAALRESCLALMYDGCLDFFHWAPFIVVGDWR